MIFIITLHVKSVLVKNYYSTLFYVTKYTFLLKKDNLLLQVGITVLCLFFNLHYIEYTNYRLLSNIKLSYIY